MKKQIYDGYLQKKKDGLTFEGLFQELLVMQMLEDSDSDIARYIEVTSNEKFVSLFNKYEELKEKFTYKKAAELYELIEACKDEWYTIISKLQTITDPYRIQHAKDRFAESFLQADDPDSNISI